MTGEESFGKLLFQYILLLVVEYISSYILHFLARGNGFLVFLSVVLTLVWMIVSIIIGKKIKKKWENANTTWQEVLIALMVYIIYSSIFWLIVCTVLWFKANA